MKRIGFSVGAVFAALSLGCAFLGFTGLPPAQTSPSPGATASPSPSPAVSPTPVATGSADPAVAGKSAYKTSCSGCHGDFGKASKTVAQIDGAISGNVGGMGSLSSLSTETKTNIAAYLATLPNVQSGKTKYDSSCAGCHSASPKSGKTRTQLDAAITANVGGMGSLSGLSSADRDLIITYSQWLATN